MKRKPIDSVAEPEPLSIAMCWDGEADTAELILDEMKFVGDPAHVEAAFDALNKLRDANDAKQKKLDRWFRAISEILEVRR